MRPYTMDRFACVLPLLLFFSGAVSSQTSVPKDPPTVDRQTRAARTPLLVFPVTDERPQFEVRVGRDLVVRVLRAVDAQGRHFGWDFAATDRRLKKRANLLYDCLCGHGPRPHDLYARHFASHYYPAERTLPVYGYPYTLRVRCVDCQVAGPEGTEIQFTRGTVEIDAERLSEANPRQLTLRDLARRRKSRVASAPWN